MSKAIVSKDGASYSGIHYARKCYDGRLQSYGIALTWPSTRVTPNGMRPACEASLTAS